MSSENCSQTPSRAIPATRRVVFGDGGVQLPPGDYSTTHSGTLLSTTMGGTRIIYDRKFLMEYRNSPVAKTPPRDLPTIHGVTSPKAHLESGTAVIDGKKLLKIIVNNFSLDILNLTILISTKVLLFLKGSQRMGI
uniref:Eukaryotic translation initiation factor 4E binding protein 1 n=1 Tax=Urocitellus parryii TaxID=9999 RepID=A0A8D2H438_UROPR